MLPLYKLFYKILKCATDVRTTTLSGWKTCGWLQTCFIWIKVGEGLHRPIRAGAGRHRGGNSCYPYWGWTRRQPSDRTPKEPRRTNRGSLPQHLPRVEEVIAPDSIICDCGCERHIIGEDVSERLDIVPSQFRVLVTRRPKYACRACENGITQAPAKPHLIEGGIPTEATLATIAINKHADHLPLFR